MPKRIDALRPSAPLPPETESVEMPNGEQVRRELTRASHELMYALNRHRTGWYVMARMKQEAEREGNAYYMDNDRAWKVAVGDVQWWRGEVNARSNSVLALTKLAELMGVSFTIPTNTTDLHAIRVNPRF